jgi:formate dehydrogenase maturation protein FdhE
MQIKCSKCGQNSNAILSKLTLSYDSFADIPVYNCENCCAHYIKIFSHAMQIGLVNKTLKPVRELIYNGFSEQ